MKLKDDYDVLKMLYDVYDDTWPYGDLWCYAGGSSYGLGFIYLNLNMFANVLNDDFVLLTKLTHEAKADTCFFEMCLMLVQVA